MWKWKAAIFLFGFSFFFFFWSPLERINKCVSERGKVSWVVTFSGVLFCRTKWIFLFFFYFTWRLKKKKKSQKSQRMTRGNAEFIHKVQQRSQMGNLWSNFTAQTHADIHVRSSSRALVMTKMNHHEEWCSSVHISHRERSNQIKRFNIFRNLWRFFLLK